MSSPVDGSTSEVTQEETAGSITVANGDKTSLNHNAPTFQPRSARANTLLEKLPAGHRLMLRNHFKVPATGEWCPYYLGTLKSFSGVTGYGFIDCPLAKEDWGMDVFIHKSAVPSPWTLGQPVEFAVTWNTRGQPQATDVNWLPRIPEPRAFKVGAGGPPDGAIMQTATVIANVIPAKGSTTVQAPQKYMGALKSYSTSQGYGFVACEAVFKKYSRDVYFDRSQLPASGNWRAGQLVEFTLSFNSKGNPQARNLIWDPVPMMPGVTPGAPGVAETNLVGGPLLPPGLPQPPQVGPSAAVGVAAAGTVMAPAYSAKTIDRLQTLFTLVNGGPSKFGEAMSKASEYQGGNQTTEDDTFDRSIDYLGFVLDRLPPPEEVVSELNNFTMLLVLLLIAKHLKQPFEPKRISLIVTWFEVLARSIDPAREEIVKENFRKVFNQVENHIATARLANPQAFAEEADDKAIASGMALLSSKQL